MTKLEKTLFIIIWIILMCSIFSNMAMETRIKELEKENEELINTQELEKSDKRSK